MVSDDELCFHTQCEHSWGALWGCWVGRGTTIRCSSLCILCGFLCSDLDFPGFQTAERKNTIAVLLSRLLQNQLEILLCCFCRSVRMGSNKYFAQGRRLRHSDCCSDLPSVPHVAAVGEPSCVLPTALLTAARGHSRTLSFFRLCLLNEWNRLCFMLLYP